MSLPDGDLQMSFRVALLTASENFAGPNGVGLPVNTHRTVK
ncbi:MAG TPA: hypothetical protein VIJ41_16545 [Candidatus Nanopelagicales bacterium]